jgi:hypothetical protein
MSHFWRGVVVPSIVLSGPLSAVVLAAPSNLQPIALTNSPVAGATGTLGNLSRAPVINSAGDVAFEGLYAGGSSRGLIVWTGGLLGQAIRSGTALPGMGPGAVVDSITFPNLADTGRIVTRVSVSPQVNHAIVAGGGSNFASLVEANTGFPSSALPFRSFDIGPLINNLDRIVFIGRHTDNSTSIWTHTGASLNSIASRGSPAPGYSAGTTFSDFGAPTLSDTGRVAYLGGTTGGTGLFLWSDGVTQRLAGTGSAAPKLSNAVFTTLATGPSLSRSGSVAITGVYTQNGSNGAGIWISSANDPLDLSPAVLSNDHLPQTPVGSSTSSFSRISINNNNNVSFTATLNSAPGLPTSARTGMWFKGPSGFLPIVRSDDPAPGLPSGYRLGLGSLDSHSALNVRDQLAFTCTLRPPGSPLDGATALCAWDRLDGLSLITYVGDAFEFAPGQFEIVTAIELANAEQPGNSFVLPGGTGGTQQCLNDAGVLTFGLRYNNGFGVFTITIPSAGTAPMMFAGSLVLLRRARRKPGVTTSIRERC